MKIFYRKVHIDIQHICEQRLDIIPEIIVRNKTNRVNFVILYYILLTNMKFSCILFHFFLCFVLLGLSHGVNAVPVPDSKIEKGKNISDSLPILDTLVEGTRVNNNRLSLYYAKDALRIARLSGKPEDLILAYIIAGTSFNTNDKDSSFTYFAKALQKADMAGTSKLKARIMYNIAMLYNAANDFKKVIDLLDSTIRLSDSAKEYTVEADAYNTLGSVLFNSGDVLNAKRMFETSFQIAKENSLYKQMGRAFANLSPYQLDNITAIKTQKEAIGYLQKAKGTEEEIANILINIGLRYNNPDSSLFYYQKALQYSKNGNLPKIEMGAYNNIAYSYMEKRNISQAESYILHAIQLATQLNDHDWLSTLYDSYGDILSDKGSYKEALIWQKKAIVEKDSAEKKQSTGQARLLAAILDMKNKELIIQNTQTDLLIQKNRLQQTRIWLIGSVLFVIAAVFTLLSIMQRNRMKFQLEQISSARRLIEMEEGEKGRIARELHDITGQLIMGITGAVEKLNLPDDRNRAEIQGKIKDLGRSIRTISHRMNKAMLEHFTFTELVTGQCEDIQKLTGMHVQLDMPEENYDLSEEMVLHTYRIVQELLTNASKYVPENTVRISFINRGENLIMSYSDNGKGFDTKELKNRGMGIMNIFERAKLLGGKAKLTSSPGNGTKWEIFIPLRVRKKSPVKTVNA
jgi:two-component system, NarL family, sensor kinase